MSKSLIGKALSQLPALERIEDDLEAVREEGGLESIAGGLSGPLGSALIKERERLMEAGKEAVRKIRKEGAKASLSPVESRGLEAIIVLVGRPAILIQSGKFLKPPPEWKILEERRKSIETNLRSVGRVEVKNHPNGLGWIGTGFLVSKDVLITNRHVAQEFCTFSESRKKFVFESGFKPNMDFNEEYKTRQAAEFALTSILGVHDKYDFAFFKIRAKSSKGKKLPPPLAVSSDGKIVKKKRKVYTVGFPASDSRRNDPEEMRRVFADIYNVKRLQPGEVMKMATAKKFIFSHDCSTLGGNSGSAVFDLETGQVLGIHFGGGYLQENVAVALWKLINDPLVKQAKVNFV